MPEKQKETIRELTLMLMYLTSWEERDTPEMRAVKKKELEKYPCPPMLEGLMPTTCWTTFRGRADQRCRANLSRPHYTGGRSRSSETAGPIWN